MTHREFNGQTSVESRTNTTEDDSFNFLSSAISKAKDSAFLPMALDPKFFASLLFVKLPDRNLSAVFKSLKCSGLRDTFN